MNERSSFEKELISENTELRNEILFYHKAIKAMQARNDPAYFAWEKYAKEFGVYKYTNQEKK